MYNGCLKRNFVCNKLRPYCTHIHRFLKYTSYTPGIHHLCITGVWLVYCKHQLYTRYTSCSYTQNYKGFLILIRPFGLHFLFEHSLSEFRQALLGSLDALRCTDCKPVPPTYQNLRFWAVLGGFGRFWDPVLGGFGFFDIFNNTSYTQIVYNQCITSV